MTNTILIAVITAYCSCKTCCGPDSPRRTSCGQWPREGITCAAPRNIPLGSILTIPGVGRRVVMDRTAKRFDGRVDVYFADHATAKRFGIRRGVRVLVKE